MIVIIVRSMVVLCVVNDAKHICFQSDLRTVAFTEMEVAEYILMQKNYVSCEIE